jgi:hypothetical protein
MPLIAAQRSETGNFVEAGEGGWIAIMFRLNKSSRKREVFLLTGCGIDLELFQDQRSDVVDLRGSFEESPDPRGDRIEPEIMPLLGIQDHGFVSQNARNLTLGGRHDRSRGDRVAP